jgi:hypothetical protein
LIEAPALANVLSTTTAALTNDRSSLSLSVMKKSIKGVGLSASGGAHAVKRCLAGTLGRPWMNAWELAPRGTEAAGPIRMS